MRKILVRTDGSSYGNPGPAGAGVEILGPKHLLACKPLGNITNNKAEYEAVILALQLLEKYEMEKRPILIETDSLLVVKQISGDYQVKNKDIKPLYNKLKLLIAKFKQVDIKHIPREENHVADLLAKSGANESKRRVTGQKWWDSA